MNSCHSPLLSERSRLELMCSRSYCVSSWWLRDLALCLALLMRTKD